MTRTQNQGALLDRARRGDEVAFRELVEPFRRELRAHGYRMLGSPEDAEEALQDTLLRAWRGLARFESRSSLRTWLYRIATNVCLTRIERRPPRTLPFDHLPAGDPVQSEWTMVEGGWVQPIADRDLAPGSLPLGPDTRYELRESVELAFLAAVQHLPGSQRAVLLLRDVLGFSAKETAEALDTTVASVTSALQRARARIRRGLPDRSQREELHDLGDVEVQRLVERYVEAWERGDAAAILAMLAEDATFSMPPYTVWYAGLEDIETFLGIGPLRTRWRLRPVEANGHLAFACYAWDASSAQFDPHSLDVVTVRDGRVQRITAFLGFDAESFARFGLPPALPRP